MRLDPPPTMNLSRIILPLLALAVGVASDTSAQPSEKPFVILAFGYFTTAMRGSLPVYATGVARTVRCQESQMR